jgi:hypothetical protein
LFYLIILLLDFPTSHSELKIVALLWLLQSLDFREHDLETFSMLRSL